MKLFLIRHAESIDNVEGRFSGLRDVKLTEKGIQQSEQLSLRLKNTEVDAVFCSDLIRARRTAEIVFKNKGIEIKANSKFRELDVGAWEGCTYKEVKSKFGYGDEFNPWMGNVGVKISIPQGEKIVSFINKVMSELNRIIKKYRTADKEKTIALVCHGVTIRAILSNVLKISISDMWNIEQDSTALSIISYFNNRTTINLINDASHLEGWWKIN